MQWNALLDEWWGRPALTYAYDGLKATAVIDMWFNDIRTMKLEEDNRPVIISFFVQVTQFDMRAFTWEPGRLLPSGNSGGPLCPVGLRMIVM